MCTGTQTYTHRQAWAHVHTETYHSHKRVHVTGMPMKYMNDVHPAGGGEVKQIGKIIQRKRSFSLRIHENVKDLSLEYTQMRTHTYVYNIERQECCEDSSRNASRLRLVVFNN